MVIKESCGCINIEEGDDEATILARESHGLKLCDSGKNSFYLFKG